MNRIINRKQNIAVSSEPSNAVDPQIFVAMTMDDISRKLTRLLIQNKEDTIQSLGRDKENNALLKHVIDNNTQLPKHVIENNTQLLKQVIENNTQLLKQTKTDFAQLLTTAKCCLEDTGKRDTNNAEIFNKLLEATYNNQKLFNSILEELRSDADEGEFLRTSGIATTTKFIIIDTQTAPGHMVKGYTIRNDGPNNIYVAHNAGSSIVDADIIDVTSNVSRFEEVLPNEDIKFVFNRRRIRNVNILASGGNSNFRAWLTW